MVSIQLNLRPKDFRKFDWFFLPSAPIVGAATIILAFRQGERTGWISALAGVLLIVQAMVAAFFLAAIGAKISKAIPAWTAIWSIFVPGWKLTNRSSWYPIKYIRRRTTPTHSMPAQSSAISCQ